MDQVSHGGCIDLIHSLAGGTELVVSNFPPPLSG